MSKLLYDEKGLDQRRDTTNILGYARLVADAAVENGFAECGIGPRVSVPHVGALLADSALQTGLRYHPVVSKRVYRIIEEYPETCKLSRVIDVVESGKTSDYLLWSHHQKISKFTLMVRCFEECGVDDFDSFVLALKEPEVQYKLLTLNGVGFKTFDYLKCLAGFDELAVDRHVRRFAENLEIDYQDYHSIKLIFSYAADLMNVSRRDFDAWMWSTTSNASQYSKQYSLI